VGGGSSNSNNKSVEQYSFYSKFEEVGDENTGLEVRYIATQSTCERTNVRENCQTNVTSVGLVEAAPQFLYPPSPSPLLLLMQLLFR